MAVLPKRQHGPVGALVFGILTYKLIDRKSAGGGAGGGGESSVCKKWADSAFGRGGEKSGRALIRINGGDCKRIIEIKLRIILGRPSPASSPWTVLGGYALFEGEN